MPVDFSEVTNNVVIIPAAGIGSRMNSQVPKQYLQINGEFILDITLNKFLSRADVAKVVLVISAQDQHYTNLKSLNNDKIEVIEGGEQRVNSVFNALKFLYDNGLPDDTPVLVHDAARPCILTADLDKLIDYFKQHQAPCFLGAAVNDTLQQVNDVGQVVKRLDRSHIVKAFTPQMASFIDLKNALKKAREDGVFVTDEVSALSYSGHQVNLVSGSASNIKITLNEDLALAQHYLLNN
ncbi:2-C-methyl-D-erythritol 4-phosphate cytidylyltransferase [Aliikangiella sp. IMCC44653]